MNNQIIDLDSLVPFQYTDQFAKNHADRRGLLFSGRFTTKNLINWREREVRMNELTEALTPSVSVFWSWMTHLLKIAKESRAQEIWVYHPSPAKQQVMVYDNSLRFISSVELTQKFVNQPNKHAYIIKGNDAIAIFDRYDRENTLHRRFDVFRRAFIESVKIRLNVFLDQMRIKNHGHCLPSSFVVKNEGRTYVFNYVNYHIEMSFPSTTYECT